MKQQRLLLKVLFLPLLLGLLVLGQGVLLAAPAEQQVQFAIPRLVVNTSFLNVRSGPGIQYSVLLTVVGGTELPVLARAEDNVWFQVSTVIGVGWVNVQYTVPRGNFDAVPIINTSDLSAFAVLPSVPSTLALPAVITTLGQGGGGGAPSPVIVSAAASTGPALGGPIRVTFARNSRATSVRPGERFRVSITADAVNLRTAPEPEASTLGTLFRDVTNDYTLVNSARDRFGSEWFAIDVVDVGTGWVEASKIRVRLSRVAGPVVIIASNNISLLDAPGGSGNNLPLLSNGEEGFYLGGSRDGAFANIELGGGLRGWVPRPAIVDRVDTPTDQIDLSLIPAASFAVPQVPVVTDLGQGGGAVVVSAFPQSFGLDTPHVVVNTGFLNVRSGPGAQYSVVATVPGGTELPVLGIMDDRVWFLVQGVWGRGWVNSEFTLFRGSIDAVPVIKDFAAGSLSAPVAIVAASAVTLYAAPGTNFGVVGSLQGPIEVPIVARTIDNQWLQVNTTAGFVWVLASQVILRGDLGLVPIVG